MEALGVRFLSILFTSLYQMSINILGTYHVISKKHPSFFTKVMTPDWMLNKIYTLWTCIGGILLTCFKRMLLYSPQTLSSLQPQIPSPLPNSISFITMWLFPTQTFFQQILCYSSVSFGCLETTTVIIPKTKESSKERQRCAQRKKAVAGQSSGHSMWLNPKLGWRVKRIQL